MSALPDSAYPRCLVCGEPIHDPDSPRVLLEIRGYERRRRGGGTNHVVAKEYTGRYVGACCAEKVQAGRVGQEVLL